MIKADMHIHSTISDGSYTMEEIVAMAEAKGLHAIAITDHDTFSHAAKLPKSDKVKVQAGVEVSAFDYNKNFRVHILGFGIKNPEILERAVGLLLYLFGQSIIASNRDFKTTWI